jgi:hypothetical protein
MEKVVPQKEHQWLQKLVGEWTSEGEAVMEPGKPAERFKGTETVRALGDLWILGEAEGDMPCEGGTARMLLTLGYDPQRGRFVGTWVGSMMTHLWVYEGTLDASQRVLTLETEGPSMAGPGKMAKYRDVIEVKSEDYRVLTSHQQGEDGTWKTFMTNHYRRKR